jgi:hypothetical protein
VSELEFGKPIVNLVRTEVQVGLKDWPIPVGKLETWIGRHCEFSYNTPDFYCMLSAKQLREIADKMDEMETK